MSGGHLLLLYFLIFFRIRVARVLGFDVGLFLGALSFRILLFLIVCPLGRLPYGDGGTYWNNRCTTYRSGYLYICVRFLVPPLLEFGDLPTYQVIDQKPCVVIGGTFMDNTFGRRFVAHRVNIDTIKLFPLEGGIDIEGGCLYGRTSDRVEHPLYL